MSEANTKVNGRILVTDSGKIPEGEDEEEEEVEDENE